jgi:hypothetical protein
VTLPRDSGQLAEKASQQGINEALRAIGMLFEPGDVIEIRALDVGRTQDHAGSTHAGYFNFENDRAISAAIRRIDGNAEGVYVVLNRFSPDLLARSNNRLRVRPKHTTNDADIIEWRWLYIDADAIRPAGISAADVEHQAAFDRILSIRQFLQGCGWPEPLHGDSGNGGHLLYLLPVLELKRAGDLVKRCLQALSARFSDSIVRVDESTATAARLCKLYGTMARKGDSTADRPHRRSALLETPERIEPVPESMLEKLASEVAVAITRSRSERPNPSSLGSFDIDPWLAQSGLDIIGGAEPYKGGRKWTFRTCPFNPEHDKPVVIEHAGGALTYRCLHKSCSGNDWHALRRLIEPGYREFARGPGAGTSSDDTPLITDLSQIPSVFSLEAQLDWCVEGMIARGSITLISAESGTGKTWVGYHIAGCVAHGVPALGRTVQSSKVLYLDGENPLYVVKQRLFDLGIAATPNLTVWGGWNLSPPVGPQNSLVIEFARQHKGVIIYDSLIEFHPGSEQSSTETRAFMRFFRALANLGATVIVLHHTGKAETSKLYRGSSDIKAAVDMAYVLARPAQESEELGKLSMICFKARLAPGRNFSMEFKKGQGFIPCEAFKLTRTAIEIISEILEENPSSNQTEILTLAKGLGCTKRQIENCLKTGPWCSTPGPKNSTLYSLPADE